MNQIVNDSRVKVEQLQSMAAFRNIPQVALERLAELMVQRAYSAGEIIFLDGDQAIGLWFVIQGRVKIIKQSLNGRVLGLCLMDRGKCFGSCPLFDTDRNPATAEAVDDVVLLILPQITFQNLANEDAPLASALLRIFSQRLSHLARLSESLGVWTVGDRINDCLLTYAEQGESALIVPLTHERIADLAGTVREVVTRHLSQLEANGFVHVEPGRIMIVNVDGLNQNPLCRTPQK
jgi:CRP/FNR family transcriptional regulator